MDTLGKYKTNFLGNKNSFNIGFNNRSPFSYKSSMPTNFISVPTISASPGDYSLSGKSNYASINSGGKQLTQGLINIGRALAGNKKNKKEKKKLEEKVKNTKNGTPKGGDNMSDLSSQVTNPLISFTRSKISNFF